MQASPRRRGADLVLAPSGSVGPRSQASPDSGLAPPEDSLELAVDRERHLVEPVPMRRGVAPEDPVVGRRCRAQCPREPAATTGGQADEPVSAVSLAPGSGRQGRRPQVSQGSPLHSSRSRCAAPAAPRERAGDGDHLRARGGEGGPQLPIRPRRGDSGRGRGRGRRRRGGLRPTRPRSATIDVPADRWSALARGGGELVAYVRPRDLH